MASTTVIDYITKTVTATASTATSSVRAAPQGGILEGSNPSTYDPKNPIFMFIIQAGIVIIFCRLLHWPLSKLRQPRVIAEVIGGVLLGPSVMGRIPGFTDAIFPTASIPNFTLVANLGLVLFLFLVGLETDTRFLVSNWKIALSVGLGGMALPFGLGCAISWGLFKEFHGEGGTIPIAFGTYMLFIAIAMAITAFPVLCRILTELKLLSTPVGVIALSAGVGNDVVGWILLALCVAIVNAGDGITALYVLLTATGWSLFMIVVVRRGFMWILKKSRSLEDGPSQSIVGLTLLMTLASAFFTGVIGIHPIFGAFLAGLICPHEGGFAIKVTEKVEDLVSTILLPLYFALSGLSTNLGLLNNGITWAYVVGVISVAFFAKMTGGSLAARANGMVWRESFTIGALMSCKGLVELIVLNIGLQAKILSQRTFTIFVVMALVTTFATTPLVAALYPPWYQRKIEQWKRGEIDWDTGLPHGARDDNESQIDSIVGEKRQAARIQRVVVYLRLDTMPGMLALTALLGGSKETQQQHPTEKAQQQHPTGKAQSISADSVGSGKSTSNALSPTESHNPMEMHGVRLIQLTDRDSSVMKVSEVDEYSAYDPVVNTFRAFGRLHDVTVSGEVAVVPETYYADTLASRAAEMETDLLLLPWSETGGMSEWQTLSHEDVRHRFAGGAYRDFASAVLRDAHCAVGVFANKGFGSGQYADLPRPLHLSQSLSGASAISPAARGTPMFASAAPDYRNTHANANAGGEPSHAHRVFVPYFGTADDRTAVRFVLQLARDPRVSVTIVHFRRPDAATRRSSSDDNSIDVIVDDDAHLTYLDLTLSPSAKDFAQHAPRINKHMPIEDIPLTERHAAFLAAMRSSLPVDVANRVTVESVVLAEGAEASVARLVAERAAQLVGAAPGNVSAGDLVVAGRNGNGSDGECFGAVGDAVARRVNASLLIMRAALH